MSHSNIKSLVTAVLVAAAIGTGFSQPYPDFGPEKPVIIIGLTFDAMEPFISPDGNTLFFNSLNSGGNTNLYHATRVNDTVFTYDGLVGGIYDPSPDHLDAVASLDSAGNFFWVSLRGYPAVFENLHRGRYSTGAVTDTTRVYGDFNIDTLGWLIMDGTINYQGDRLYYNNAYFNLAEPTGIPEQARLGAAQRIDDSTFNKLPDTEEIFAAVNDAGYLVYAPQITGDGLELYFTRLLKNTINTEICLALRAAADQAFGPPVVLHSNPGYVPEAPTLTLDKQVLYYHQKDSAGIFRIFLRYRSGAAGVVADEPSPGPADNFRIYPNPARNLIHIASTNQFAKYRAELYTILGQRCLGPTGLPQLDLSGLPGGIYFLRIREGGRYRSFKFVKE